MQALTMDVPQVFIPFTPSSYGIDSPKMSDPKERFFRHFQAAVTIIQDQIQDLSTMSAINGERKDCTDTILAGISRLNKEVIDAGDYIPAYDQRAYSQAIKGLTEKLNETTGKFKPKSRFQFKPRTQRPGARQQPAADPRSFSPSDNTNTTTATTATTSPQSPTTSSLPSSPTAATDTSKDYNAAIQADASPSSIVRRPSFSQAKRIVLHSQSGVRIAVPSPATTSTSTTSATSPQTQTQTQTQTASITDLDRCVLDLTKRTAAQPLAALALQNVRRSVVAAGRVDGAVHITGVADAVVMVADARQVRIHECRNVHLYLRCASHPIIEDCEGMRFAPVGEGVGSIPDEEQKIPNQWDQVDDFKWLKSEPSPNWSVLPEEKRISEAVWRDVLDGDANATADEILRKVGVLGA